jgi:hypothetical protein
MEPEGSLQCSQETATGLCPKSYEFSPYLPTLFRKIILILSSCLRLGFWASVSSMLYNEGILRIYKHPHARYMPRPSHRPWSVVLIISGEEYKLRM